MAALAISTLSRAHDHGTCAHHISTASPARGFAREKTPSNASLLLSRLTMPIGRTSAAKLRLVHQYIDELFLHTARASHRSIQKLRKQIDTQSFSKKAAGRRSPIAPYHAAMATCRSYTARPADDLLAPDRTHEACGCHCADLPVAVLTESTRLLFILRYLQARCPRADHMRGPGACLTVKHRVGPVCKRSCWHELACANCISQKGKLGNQKVSI